MKDYEKEIGKLTPDRKLELWSKVKDLNFSNKTKYALIYYYSVSHGYIKKVEKT